MARKNLGRPHPNAVLAAQVSMKGSRILGRAPNPDMVAILEAEEYYARLEAAAEAEAEADSGAESPR